MGEALMRQSNEQANINHDHSPKLDNGSARLNLVEGRND